MQTHYRGILKRGQRRKGIKARLDGLQQARKDFFASLERYEEARMEEAEYRKTYGARHYYWTGFGWAKEFRDRSSKRYFALLAQCEKDGIKENNRV